MTQQLNPMAGDKKELVFGVILLRVALIAGIYVILIVATTIRPMPGVSPALFNFFMTLEDLAFLVGLIAPLVAIVGAVLLWVRRRRFKPLDWVSLAIGLSTVLLPALFVIAYSNCPNGVC